MLKLATKFIPHRDAFHTAVAAGFEFAELWTSAQVLADWQAVAAEAQRCRLRYTLHFPNRKELPAETVVQAVALYRQLNCRAMVIHEPQLTSYGERLYRMLPDICLAVENHYVARDELIAWGEKVAFITLDFEHLWKFTLGDVPLDEFVLVVGEFLRRFGHKLRHVHLPGYLPGFGEHRPMYCSREMTFAVWNLLSEIDFQGFVVSEVDVPFQNTSELQMDVLLFEVWKQQRSGAVAENMAD